MSKKVLQQLSEETISDIFKTAEIIHNKNIEVQKEQILKDSPYSEAINNFFASYNEFCYLASLGLYESKVTRPALVRDIRLDLFIDERQLTNLELMKNGQPPYLKNDKNSQIILHHIGQNYAAPFAELTLEEHAYYGNSKLLHISENESWRRENDKETEFNKERNRYWIIRAKQESEKQKVNKINVTIGKQDYANENNIIEIKSVLDKMFSECSVSDLNFISNLAKNHIFYKEFGVDSIEDFIRNMKGQETNVICPACKSSSVMFYGTYRTTKDKRQKYCCKDCGKIFSSFHGTIIQDCTLSLFEWLQFIDCLYNGYSISKTAQLCNLSEKAAFDNRLRVFYALSILEANTILRGNIVIDETYITVSYKGNRTNDSNFKMPRKSRKRGGEDHTKGLSKNKVCVVCALDDEGNSVARVGGLGAPNAKKLKWVLQDNIDFQNVISIYSDLSPTIRAFADKNNLEIHQTKSMNSKSNTPPNRKVVRYVQQINSYHSRLHSFMSRFSGVSSELVPGYLMLFAWKDRNRNKPLKDAYTELLSIMLEPNRNKTMEEIINFGVFQSPFDVENATKVGRAYFQNEKSEKKSRKIYELYAKGVPVQMIAKKFKCTPQAITRRIRNFGKFNMAYKTEKDILKEKQREENSSWKRELIRTEKNQKMCDIYMDLYNTKKSWEGSLEEFYIEAEKKYHLSRQTIKNNIAYAKRILNLREFFAPDGNYKYSTVQEVFDTVEKRYQEIIKTNPGHSNQYYYKILAEEFDYSVKMIISILNQTQKGIDWGKRSKIKLPMSQTLNRDRVIFVECLKWIGTKEDFLNYISNKYNVSKGEIYRVIRLNCMADTKRYYQSRLD